MSKTQIAFREVQRFRQPWVWIIVIVIAALCWFSFVQQVILGVPFDKPPPPDALLVITWLIFGLGLPSLFLWGSLTTEVRDDGIYIKFAPFHFSFHRIAFTELKD